MHVRNFVIPTDSEELACVEITPPAHCGRALVLHGAGTGHKERYLSLLTDLADEGLAATAFDFSGHGASTGSLKELSLARRARQAESVLDAVNTDRTPVTAIGFSMSGQTVCDLLKNPSNNIHAAVLGCPAAYAERARGLPFGQPEFTAVLRTPDSWRDSTAFSALRSFAGPVMVVRPRADAVIPDAVTEHIVRNCPPERTEDVVLDDATHEIYRWLDERPDQRRALARRIARLVVKVS